MNCQDISRLVDTGSINNMSAAERSAADAHARSCRHCAAIWGVQSRLAALRVPATPPQVASKLQMLAALPEQATRGSLPRRLTLIGSLIAMAAAAALVIVRQADAPAMKPPAIAAVVAAAPEPVWTAATEPVATPVVAQQAAASPRTDKPVSLLPPPDNDSGARMRQFNQAMSQMDLALEKAVARHPELVEGPQIDGTFVVGVALKTDGSVLTSEVRHAPPGTVGVARAEIQALIPGDDGAVATRPKSTRLHDGRSLRADAVVLLSLLPDGFDLTRSRARVLQILGDRYAYLMAPVSNGGMNRLEIFLSDDGRILREQVDVVRQGDSGTSVTKDPADIGRFAEGIAARLGLDATQVGVVGFASVSQSVELPTLNPAGGTPLTQDTPRMLINYAWARRAGESASTLGHAAAPQGIDQMAALALVERYVPDAFVERDASAGQPALLLTASGEFIRAGRLPPRTPPFSVSRTLRDQLGARAPLGLVVTTRLTNNAGVAIDVHFAWERSPETPAGSTGGP